MSDISHLETVLRDLHDGRSPPKVSIREFLSWFGAKRRTKWNVEYINDRMADAGLRAVPNYLGLWVDSIITFELVTVNQESNTGTKADASADADSVTAEYDVELTAKTADDPSFRIGRIASATNPPVRVKPNASLQEAMTLMLAHSFSQIPVMPNDRDVKGVVSWASIGARIATNTSGPDVQSYMDAHHELNVSASLFSAIQIIRDHNYVLTRSTDKKIAGIVTADDIASEFELISTPFLLLAEIENNLRSLIRSKLTISDVRAACSEEYLPKDFSNMAELTFGNYVRILENNGNWAKVGLTLDRQTLCTALTEVNEIRNDVMHFDPEPLEDTDLTRLRNMARMFDMLRKLGAF